MPPVQRKYVKSCGTALAKTGVKATGMTELGSGFFGTAYLLQDGRVLKVTGDSREFALASWLAQHRTSVPTLLPRIDYAFRAVCASRSQPPYYIVREDLRDLHSGEVDDLDSPEGEHLRRLDALVFALDRWMGRQTPTHEKLLSAAIANSGYPAAWQKRVRDGLRWMKSNGIFVTDIKLDGLGVRPSTGDLVLRDLGGAVLPTEGKKGKR